MDLLTANDRAGEYPPSYYAVTAKGIVAHPSLQGDLQADVCVVGGGYTGLSAALHLAQRGYSVVLLEAQRVGFGASGRNGGQVGSGQRLEPDALEKLFGAERAKTLWDMGEEAKETVKSLVAAHSIACDLKPGVLHAELRPRNVGAYAAEVEKLRTAYNYDKIEFLDRDAVRAALGTTAYHGGTLDRGAAHLHPLNYALGLAQACVEAGVKIFENSRVTEVRRGSKTIVRTKAGKITAGFAVVGCNGYLGDLEPEVAARAMPINNFIVATEPLGRERARALIRDDVAVADSKFVVNYFRLSADHRLLFGGGESYGYKFPKDIAAKARNPMLQIYPQLKDVKIDYAWGGTLAITRSRLPAFRRLSENIFAAGGYSGHGVAMATLAGKLMAEAIAGTAERFDIMASVPTPRFPGGTSMRWPLLALAMSWYALRDRL